MHKQSFGFSLIELMVTVAIGAILMSIAIPSYQSYIERSRHAEAQTALMGLAQAMEQTYAAAGTYTGATGGSTTCSVASPCSQTNYPVYAPIDGAVADRKWDVKVVAVSATSYTIRATATSTASCLGTSSAKDYFSLDSTGQKVFYDVPCGGGTAVTHTGCWNTRDC